MTAVAALVAEAIAFAKEATSDRVRNHPRTTWLSGDVEGMTVLDPVRYHRDDVVDAALAHLVARVVGAEGRAERAEARVAAFATAILDVDFDSLPTLIEYARQIRKEDAEKEAGRG